MSENELLDNIFQTETQVETRIKCDYRSIQYILMSSIHDNQLAILFKAKQIECVELANLNQSCLQNIRTLSLFMNSFFEVINKKIESRSNAGIRLLCEFRKNGSTKIENQICEFLAKFKSSENSFTKITVEQCFNDFLKGLKLDPHNGSLDSNNICIANAHLLSTSTFHVDFLNMINRNINKHLLFKIDVDRLSKFLFKKPIEEVYRDKNNAKINQPPKHSVATNKSLTKTKPPNSVTDAKNIPSSNIASYLFDSYMCEIMINRGYTYILDKIAELITQYGIINHQMTHYYSNNPQMSSITQKLCSLFEETNQPYLKPEFVCTECLQKKIVFQTVSQKNLDLHKSKTHSKTGISRDPPQKYELKTK